MKHWFTVGLLLSCCWFAKIPLGLTQVERVEVNQQEEQQVVDLINQLKDSDPNVRWRAADRLGDLGSEAAVAPLINALQDPDLVVRRIVVEALRKIGSEAAVNPLITIALEDPDSAIRRAAGVALRKIDSEVAVDPLINALEDPDSEVRRNAASTLGWTKPEVAIDPLINALEDPDSEVRRNAAYALGQIYDEVGWTAPEVAIDPLINALEDPDPEVRRRTAHAFRGAKLEVAVDPLVNALQDPDLEVRMIVALVLEWYTLEEEAVEKIVSGLLRALQESEDSGLQARLIQTLRSYKNSSQGPVVTIALVDQLNDSTEPLINRYRAINILIRQAYLQDIANSSDLIETLSDLALQEEEDRFVRYGAFLLLSSVNTPKAFSLLDVHKSNFLGLVEDNYAVRLPYYLPRPLKSDQTEPPDPFDETTIIAALDPYRSTSNDSLIDPLQAPIIPSIHQGAEPGDVYPEVIVHLPRKPAICRFYWVAKNWSRCHD